MSSLEAMDLDAILRERILAHLILVLAGQELHHFQAMVALELDHLAELSICDDSAVAGIDLLEGFEKSFRTIFFGETLNGR